MRGRLLALLLASAASEGCSVPDVMFLESDGASPTDVAPRDGTTTGNYQGCAPTPQSCP